MGDPARGTGEKGAPVQRGPAPQSTAEMREVGGLERKACKPLPLHAAHTKYRGRNNNVRVFCGALAVRV